MRYYQRPCSDRCQACPHAHGHSKSLTVHIHTRSDSHNLGRGIEFCGKELSFSALPYTPHELENAMHSYELPTVYYTVVRVALQQMGVAGDDSWGARTHEEYLIDVTRPLKLEFDFKGI